MHATTLAVIAEDFSFVSATGSCHLDIHQTTDINITFTTLCICKQKNNDNSQRLTYQCCSSMTWMSLTQASISIICCANCLRTPHNNPVAIYLDAPSSKQ